MITKLNISKTINRVLPVLLCANAAYLMAEPSVTTGDISFLSRVDTLPKACRALELGDEYSFISGSNECAAYKKYQENGSPETRSTIEVPKLDFIPSWLRGHKVPTIQTISPAMVYHKKSIPLKRIEVSCKKKGSNKEDCLDVDTWNQQMPIAEAMKTNGFLIRDYGHSNLKHSSEPNSISEIHEKIRAKRQLSAEDQVKVEWLDQDMRRFTERSTREFFDAGSEAKACKYVTAIDFVPRNTSPKSSISSVSYAHIDWNKNDLQQVLEGYWLVFQRNIRESLAQQLTEQDLGGLSKEEFLNKYLDHGPEAFLKRFKFRPSEHGPQMLNTWYALTEGGIKSSPLALAPAYTTDNADKQTYTRRINEDIGKFEVPGFLGHVPLASTFFRMIGKYKWNSYKKQNGIGKDADMIKFVNAATQYKEEQDWYYVPQMPYGFAYIFDSFSVPHGAFSLPGQTEARVSAEIRTLCLVDENS